MKDDSTTDKRTRGGTQEIESLCAERDEAVQHPEIKGLIAETKSRMHYRYAME